jgi:uncharacterized protein (TIGR02996 family)
MSLTAPLYGPRPRPEVLAFLAEIKDQPEDDAPRLLLADWLEEHGDPRGEFMRLQVMRARMALRDARQKPVDRREQELLGQYREAWLGPLLKFSASCKFERGLVRIAVHAPAHLAVAAPDSAATEAFAWIDGVTSIAAMTADAVEMVASFPLLSHVNEFCLNAMRLGPHGAARLAALPALARLAVLYLWNGGIGPDGAAALAASPHLRNLRMLRLNGHRIGPDGAAALAQSPHLTRLTVLQLSHNELGRHGVAALAASPILAGVAELNLNVNGIGAAGARALAESSYLTRLTALHLADETIGPMGAAALKARFGRRVHLTTRSYARPTEPVDSLPWWRSTPALGRL